MSEITARLIVHDDVEKPQILRRLREGGQLDFGELVPAALLARKESGIEVRLPLLSIHQGTWAHRPIDLDGHSGWSLMGWFEIEIECPEHIYEDICNDHVSLTWDMKSGYDLSSTGGGLLVLECAPLVVASLTKACDGS